MMELIKTGIIKPDAPTWLFILGIALCVIVPYLLGSINFAVIISRGMGDDVRDHGSGNAGATNMMRVHGKKIAALTFLGDALKSVMSVLFALLLMPGDEFAYIAAFFCMVGHAYPVFFGFHGGKGVAVAAAAMLILNPAVCIVSIAVFALIVLGTKFVSLGSIIASIIFPILNYKLPVYTPSLPIKTIFCVLMAAMIIFLHRKNILRLMNGTESKIGRNKPDKLK